MSPKEETKNSERQFKEYISRYVEAMNAADWEAFDKLVDTTVTSEYIGHLPGVSGPVRGPEGLKQWFRGVIASNPGYHATVEDIFAVGDKGAIRFKVRRNNPATGKVQLLTSIYISHFKGGKATEEWELVGKWEDVS